MPARTCQQTLVVSEWCDACLDGQPELCARQPEPLVEDHWLDTMWIPLTLAVLVLTLAYLVQASPTVVIPRPTAPVEETIP